MNTRNYFQVIGRLTEDVKVFDNKDGSKKIRFTVAARDNFARKDGERSSQFIPVEVFRNADSVAKTGLGLYANVHKGDLVCVSGNIANNNYTDKDGNKHYDLVLQVASCDMLEPKSVTDMRQISRATQAADAAVDNGASDIDPEQAV